MSDLEKLLVVQGHDTRSDQLRHRRAALPERAALAAIEKVIADIDGEAKAASVDRDGLAAKQERMEVDLTADLRKAAELDRRLSQTVVPREAEAFQAEAKVVAAHRSHLEDDIIALMETIEPIEIRLAEIATQRAELVARAAVAREELTRAEAVIDAELAEVTAARRAAAEGLPDSLLARYERQRARLGGIAVARLEHGHCTGCNLEISRSELDALLARPPDALVECEHCGRLLVR
jgi:predicted  nucleic acid-binding Zn-ribbon protein